VGRNALVAMNAVVMDGPWWARAPFVAAMAFVKAGFAVPAGTLVAGIPARVVRELAPEEIAWKSAGTREYQELARQYRRGFGLRAPARGRAGPAAGTGALRHQAALRD
jgi:phenylacetic acid degradation protein